MSMRHLKAVAALVSAGLVLAGCGSDASGTVTEKKQLPPRCKTYDAKHRCKTWESTLHYQLCFRPDGEDGQTCRSVPETVWRQYAVGDQYPRS